MDNNTAAPAATTYALAATVGPFQVVRCQDSAGVLWSIHRSREAFQVALTRREALRVAQWHLDNIQED